MAHETWLGVIEVRFVVSKTSNYNLSFIEKGAQCNVPGRAWLGLLAKERVHDHLRTQMAGPQSSQAICRQLVCVCVSHIGLAS